MDAAESVEYANELANIARAEVLADYLRLRLVREVVVPSPAAGAEWVQVVPAGAIWELLTVQETLTTSAVVGSRVASLRVRDADAALVTRISPAGSFGASSAINVSFSVGLGDHLAVAHVQSGLPTPPLVLPSGWSVGSLTSSFDVGDQYSAIVLTVREWSIGQVYWLADLVARDLSFEAQRERRA